MHRALLILPMLTACTGLEGRWDGRCDYDDGTYGYTTMVTAEIATDRSHQLEGQLTLQLWDGRDFQGTLSGEHTGEYMKLSADFETEEGPWTFTAEGDLEEDILDGECRLKVPNGSGALAGLVVLQR